jgi:hypothetical protein
MRSAAKALILDDVLTVPPNRNRASLCYEVTEGIDDRELLIRD